MTDKTLHLSNRMVEIPLDPQKRSTWLPTYRSQALTPQEVHRVEEVVRELGEYVDVRKQLLACLHRDATVEFLQEQIDMYKDDPEDELQRTMTKLVRDLKQGG